MMPRTRDNSRRIAPPTGAARTLAALIALAAACPLAQAQLEPAQALDERDAKAAIAKQRVDLSAPLSPETEARIARLDDLSWAVRDKAMQELMDDPGLPPLRVEHELKTRTLSPEARQRLLQVARRWFVNLPRPAMGVGFDLRLRQRVAIDRAYTPFDAAAKLEPGDIIIEADGIPLRGPNAQAAMQAIIVSHDPGDSVPVVVRRGKQRVPLSITLGYFRDLPNNQGGMIPEERVQRAWKVRAARLLPAVSEPVSVTLPADASWSTGDPDLQRQAQFINRHAQEQAPAVAGGGVARQAARIDPPEQFVQQIIIVGGQRQIINFPRQNVFMMERDERTLSPSEEIDELVRIRLNLLTQMRRFPDPDDPKLSPAEAVLARAQLEPYLEQLKSVDRMRQAIETEVAEAAGPQPQSAIGAEGPAGN